MASKVLTISIGNEYTKICEVTYSAQKAVHVHAAATVPTPEASVEDGTILDVCALAKVIKETTDANNMNTKNVIFTMQSTRIASKEVITPCLKERRLKEFLNTNATEYFPVNIDEYVIAYSILETVMEDTIKKYRIMVVAAPVTMVEPYYQLGDMLGYNIQSIDYVGNSTLQLIRLQVDTSPSIVIQMGEDSTIVSILNNNVLQLMRTVPYGKSTVAAALMDKRDIKYEEAVETMITHSVLKTSLNEGDYVTDSLKYLVNNISRVMDYYTTKNPEHPIEKAYIMSEGPGIIGIEQLLTYELNIKVDKIEMLCQIIAAPELNMNLTSLSLYLSNLGAVLQPVNFIPKSAADKVKKANNNKYFLMMLLGAFLIGILILAMPVTNYLKLTSQKKDLQSKISKADNVQQTVDAYYDAVDRYTDMESFKNFTENADDSMLAFIEFLENKMPSDISVSSLSVASGSVTMSCTGSSKETLAQFILTLQSVDNISNVYVASFSESKDSGDNITVSYTIVLNFTEFETEEEAE